MKYVFASALIFAVLILFACGDNPAETEDWPDGASLYISSTFPDTALAWSPTGNVLLFSSFAYSSYCIFGFDGTSDPIPVAASDYNESAGPTGCWSAQQGLIAYVASESATRSSVRTVPGNLGALLVVVDDDRRHFHPTWTADEDSLLMSTFDNGYWGLYATPYHEDSLLTPQPFYTPAMNCLRPSYSPDGEHIIFEVQDNGKGSIWIVDSDGSNAQSVVDDTFCNIHPTWGPHSDRFAFASDRSGNFDIWIADINGGTMVQVTDQEDSDLWPAWNPQHGWLAFASNRITGDDNYDIFTIDEP